jgi:uncharacterized protein (TIGR01244 family)
LGIRNDVAARLTRACAALPLGLLAGCSTSKQPATLTPVSLGTMKPIHAHGEVYLAGQPSAADLELAAGQGIATVLDLRSADEERGFDEPVRVRELGMEYLQVPFKAKESLTDEVFDRTRAVLNDAAQHPVLVHCATANRVGAVWLAHRVVDGGLAWEDALAEAKAVGLRSADYEALARAYVERRR